MMIGCANPLARYEARRQQLDDAIRSVLDSGRYILGPETEAFEKEFADYLGATHALGVGSGTDALHLALRACDIGPGDEVITVSHTAVATVAAIEMAGARPVLVDIDPDYYTMDPRELSEAITERTKAVVPVHLYGHPAEMKAIMQIARDAGLRVIEDACQAHGATDSGQHVGTIGDVGCFSFYPTKNLGGIGDGGALTTNDPVLAKRVRQLRQYGWKERFVSETAGWNSRLDEIQAAILRVHLRHLDADNARRAELAARWLNRLRSLLGDGLPSTRPDATHVFHQFVIRHPERDRLLQRLAAAGVAAGIHYPVPVHLQPAYQGRLECGPLPVTARTLPQIMSLPLYPELTDQDIENAADALQQSGLI